MVLKRTNVFSRIGLYNNDEDLRPLIRIDTLIIVYNGKEIHKDCSTINYATFNCECKYYRSHYSYSKVNGERIKVNKQILKLFPKDENDLIMLELDLNLGGK